MGIFDKVKDPVFIKESSSATEQLRQLEELLPVVSNEDKKKLEQDIRFLKAGIVGEDRISFELKNSHMPMWILHDLYLKSGDLSAQIDYLIITKRRNFVIECKNLFGNITIDSSGNFVRTVQYGKNSIKEGIYSPITQNERHLELIKLLRSETKTNFISKRLFEKGFYEQYRSVVVLANPQTVLNSKYAKKEVKQQVIRADQLIKYIKDINAKEDMDYSNDQESVELAQFFLNKSIDNPTDYTSKYKINNPVANLKIEVAEENQLKDDEDVLDTKENMLRTDQKSLEREDDVILCPKCGSPMIKRKATRGENAGKEFYGCSRFPHCRGIINIDK